MPTLEMYYPGTDWFEQTLDQIRLKIEAVEAKEAREYYRIVGAFNGIEEGMSITPVWTLDDADESTDVIEPLDAPFDVQRGIVEAVERGLIVDKHDGPAVWRLQLLGVWKNLLAATGDLGDWFSKKRERDSRAAKGGALIG